MISSALNEVGFYGAVKAVAMHDCDAGVLVARASQEHLHGEVEVRERLLSQGQSHVIGNASAIKQTNYSCINDPSKKCTCV